MTSFTHAEAVDTLSAADALVQVVLIASCMSTERDMSEEAYLA